MCEGSGLRSADLLHNPAFSSASRKLMLMHTRGLVWNAARKAGCSGAIDEKRGRSEECQRGTAEAAK
eukprot:379850-Pyramimonas_sp.AAC.1